MVKGLYFSFVVHLIEFNFVNNVKRASGSVYVATENATGNKIAIKQIIISKQVNKQVVVNEIMLMKLCKHHAIVQYLDSFILSGTLWVAMELINGEDLTQLISANKLNEAQIATITREVSSNFNLKKSFSDLFFY